MGCAWSRRATWKEWFCIQNKMRLVPARRRFHRAGGYIKVLWCTAWNAWKQTQKSQITAWISFGLDCRLMAASIQIRNAKLFGNHDNTNKMSESSVDWSGPNVEWKNRTIDEVRTICGRKVSGQKNVSESVRWGENLKLESLKSDSKIQVSCRKYGLTKQ